MENDKQQVQALQQAIVQRAEQLAQEHIHQGEMTRNKILDDAREKLKILEQKELLTAKVNSDREYQRLVQASELRIQAEMDRNRWGLVQSVMENLQRELDELFNDRKRYQSVFRRLMSEAVQAMNQTTLKAALNSEDLNFFSEDWKQLVQECCGSEVEIELMAESCQCSGGLRLYSESGDVMVDNTFEGILARKDEELQRIIFERLFSTVNTMGAVFNG